MSNNEEIKLTVKKFIKEEFIDQNFDLRDNTPLFEDGIIDSMGIIRLIIFIEKQYNIVINPIEVTMENFDTVQKISIIIEKKINV